MMSQKGEIRLTYNAAFARFENNPARQAAYRIWAADHTKPITELMPAINAAARENLALRTVQEWRHRDHWDDRLAWELLATSERIVIDHVIGLRVAAPESIAYLRAVVSGDAVPDPGRISAAKTLIAENRVLVVAMAERLVPPDDSTPVLAEDLTNEELLALALQGRDADQE
jgi:hypothetical protein